MMKEGISMIFLPESIERTLERLKEAYNRDIKKHRSYCSSISENGKTYTGTDTVKIVLKHFEEFKASLENGTSDLLVCKEGEEDEGEVVILKVEDSDDEESEEESYVSVEDEDTLNKVFEIFKEKFKDDFDFVD